MSELRLAIDGLAAIDVTDMPASALGEHVRELMAQRNRLDGQIERALGVFDARGYCETDGVASTTAWLRGRCHITASEAASRVNTARGLRDLPATAAALEAGAISLSHARAITMLASDTDLKATQDIEEQLVALAAMSDPVRFSVELRRLREGFKRDGSDGKDNEKPDDPDDDYRRLSVVASFEGRFNLEGWLTPEGGALLKAALDALAKPVPGDTRTARQRYADALVQLARGQLDGGGLPAKNDVRPHMFVAAKAAPGTPWNDGKPASDDVVDNHPSDHADNHPSDHADDIPPTPNDDADDGANAGDDTAADRPSPNDPRPGPKPAPDGVAIRLTDGVVIGGGALSDKALQRIACDATITRVLFGPDGHVLDLGRAVRVVTAAQWRALLLRDSGCVIPGHDCPAAHCQAHHLISWLDGGPTDLWNLAAVCTFGHTLLHERGYRLYLNKDNCWILEKPNGEQIIGLPLGQTGHANIASIEVAMLNGPRGPCGD